MFTIVSAVGANRIKIWGRVGGTLPLVPLIVPCSYLARSSLTQGLCFNQVPEVPYHPRMPLSFGIVIAIQLRLTTSQDSAHSVLGRIPHLINP